MSDLEKLAGPWIEWKGGPCPVAADTWVAWKEREYPDEAMEFASAGSLDWSHNPNHRLGTDIIAYRITPIPSSRREGGE